jgi:hypothetical protein
MKQQMAWGAGKPGAEDPLRLLKNVEDWILSSR